MASRKQEQQAQDRYITDQLVRSRVPSDWSGGGTSWSRSDGVEVRIGVAQDAGQTTWIGRDHAEAEWVFVAGGDAVSAIRAADMMWTRGR